MNDDDLRDCFAMFALNGMVSAKDWFGNCGTWTSKKTMLDTYAEEAYGFADAMLIARKLKEKENEESNDGGIVSVAPKRTYRRKG